MLLIIVKYIPPIFLSTHILTNNDGYNQLMFVLISIINCAYLGEGDYYVSCWHVRGGGNPGNFNKAESGQLPRNLE